MDWKLELVVVPVTDVERAKRFYSEQVGFAVDHDTRVDDRMHIVQLTPPGSACSIAIGTGLVETPPGTVQGLQLVVPDIRQPRPAGRAGRRGQPGPALRGRRPGRRPGRPVELVHLLQRPRRQRLDRPGTARGVASTPVPGPDLPRKASYTALGERGGTADAPGLGPGGATRGGSNPPARTPS